jgi:hypothetical protein
VLSGNAKNSPDNAGGTQEKKLSYTIGHIKGDTIYPLKYAQGTSKIVIIKNKKAYLVRLIGMIFDSNKSSLLPYALPGIRASSSPSIENEETAYAAGVFAGSQQRRKLAENNEPYDNKTPEDKDAILSSLRGKRLQK